MSANSHQVCPRCYPDFVAEATEVVWSEDHPNEVRENYETYWRVPGGNGEVGIPEVVHDYRADCWTCGWHYETVMTAPLTGHRTP